MTIKTLSTLAAVLAAGFAFAQDGESAPAAEAAEGAQAPKAEPAKVFSVLPYCHQFEGVAETLLPGTQEWRLAEEGKFYPLGTSYRTKGPGSRLVIVFGPESKAVLTGDSSFGTRPQPLGETSRTVVLGDGTLSLDLARNLPEGAFFVAAAGFTVKNPAGESKFVQKAKPDGTEWVVRCVTGSLGIEGRHYDIPQMRAADEIRVRGTADNLETFLYGTSGDYIVKIDRGIVTHPEVDSEGQMKSVSEKAVLDWHLSPKTKVRINRLAPAIGERMSVAVMTFDATGAMKNNFAYSEGRAEVNTGELVAPEKQDADEKTSAQKAAAAAEDTTTTAPAEDEADADTKNDNNNNED